MNDVIRISQNCVCSCKCHEITSRIHPLTACLMWCSNKPYTSNASPGIPLLTPAPFIFCPENRRLWPNVASILCRCRRRTILEHHRVDFVYLFLQVIFMSGFAMRLAMWIHFWCARSKATIIYGMCGQFTMNPSGRGVGCLYQMLNKSLAGVKEIPYDVTLQGALE